MSSITLDVVAMHHRLEGYFSHLVLVDNWSQPGMCSELVNAQCACARRLQYSVCLFACLLPISWFLFTFRRQIIPTYSFFALFCSFQSRWTYTTCGYDSHVGVRCHAHACCTIFTNSAKSINRAAQLSSGPSDYQVNGRILIVGCVVYWAVLYLQSNHEWVFSCCSY